MVDEGRETMQLREEQSRDTTKLVFTGQDDTFDQRTVTSLNPVEFREFFEFWSHIKPIGPDIKIDIKQGSQTACRLAITGTELGSARLPNAHLPAEISIG